MMVDIIGIATPMGARVKKKIAPGAERTLTARCRQSVLPVPEAICVNSKPRYKNVSARSLRHHRTTGRTISVRYSRKWNGVPIYSLPEN
jgi:hypothetical protein